MNTKIIRVLFYYPSKNIFADAEENIEYNINRVLGMNNIETFKKKKTDMVVSVKTKNMLSVRFPSYIASHIYGKEYIKLIYEG